jgi:hypothetical protein
VPEPRHRRHRHLAGLRRRRVGGVHRQHRASPTWAARCRAPTAATRPTCSRRDC